MVEIPFCTEQELIMGFRQWILKIHLYGGLLCFWCLVIFAIRSLHYHHEAGKDIVVYGGSSFVSALIRDGLIDEFQFYINPVALGKGVHIFHQLDKFKQLKLKKSVTFDSGIIMVTYEPR